MGAIRALHSLRKTLMASILRRWAFALLLVTLFAAPAVRAQSTSPVLHITRIDTSTHPDVELFVRGDNLEGDLSTMPIQIVEDGEPISLVLPDLVEVGTQTAILIDASGSILDPGIAGQPRFVDVAAIVRRAIESGTLSSQSGWLGIFAPDAEGKMQIINEWTLDHGAVANSLAAYRPPDGNARVTPLYDLLFFTLDNMKNDQAPPNVARSIVLFSDGVTGNSSLELNDAVTRASNEGVPIHTVLLGPGTEGTQLDMQRIATLTGGQTLRLDRAEALDGLWPAIAAQRMQTRLSYHSPHANPKDITVTVTLPDGRKVSASQAMPGLSNEPATVTIIRPQAALEIRREGVLPDTPVEELVPNELQVEIEIDWGEQRERAIRRVEYTLHTETVARNEPPFNQVAIPITKLDSGRYTLRAVVIDEIGVRSESDPLSVEITAVRPEPLPERGAGIELLGIFIPQGVLVAGASLLAVVLGAVALVAVLRRVNPPSEASESDPQAMPNYAPVQPRAPSLPKGRLYVEDRGRATTLPSILDIPGGTTRIGRAAEYANLVIEDSRVSRLHCRIDEDAQGHLCLFDEPGSSGTYVNYNPISIEGYVLQSGDTIHIGPIQVRFQYVNDSPARRATGSTEVYTPPSTSL